MAHVADNAHISVRGLTMAYGSCVLQRDPTFDVRRGDIFFIMGGSGCGKSTLLRHMLGLIDPAAGDILFKGKSFVRADDDTREAMRRRWGISYQSGGLFSAMTPTENVALPLQLYTAYSSKEISGGMSKRAALARLSRWNRRFFFFDEPSAGLDPINSRLLDAETHTMIDYGPPQQLRDNSEKAVVRQFLNRGDAATIEEQQ